MSRPLMQQGVAQLEELFKRSRSDVNVLKQLEYELQHRKVPKATTLLVEVQAAISGAVPAGSSPDVLIPSFLSDKSSAPNIQQPELWDRPALTPVAATATIDSPSPPMLKVGAQLRTVVPSPPSPEEPVMPLGEAYKILKATPSSTWESIEQTRRELVQQSLPSRIASLGAEKRLLAQAEAKRVNAAYAALWRARGGAV